mmetsp:Transcript_8555/g.13493  ORF Transcript_8555/g.13493 Transcript_8555/m.13493 type:complete len:265 (+) Transcript_8555:683-1477(+)
MEPGDTTVEVKCVSFGASDCERRKVIRFVSHPCFTAAGGNDIALWELDEPVLDVEYQKVDGVNTVCAPVKPGDTVVLAGYGETSVKETQDDVGFPSEDLLRVDVALRTKDECEGRFMDNFEVTAQQLAESDWNFDHNMCVGGTAGKDSCQGDSGGPVFAMSGSEFIQIGTAIQGTADGCAQANEYGVYSVTRYYADWIEAVINGNRYSCSSCPCVASANSITDSSASGNCDDNTVSRSARLSPAPLVILLASLLHFSSVFMART